jgi:hypothetical protein
MNIRFGISIKNCIESSTFLAKKKFIENQPVGDHGHFFRETSLRGSTGEFVVGNFFPENIDDSM